MIEFVDSKHVAASVEIGFVGGATLLYDFIRSHRAKPRPLSLIIDGISNVYQLMEILVKKNVPS